MNEKTKFQCLLAGQIVYNKYNDACPFIYLSINNKGIGHINKKEKINKIEPAVSSINHTFLPG